MKRLNLLVGLLFLSVIKQEDLLGQTAGQSVNMGGGAVTIGAPPVAFYEPGQRIDLAKLQVLMKVQPVPITISPDDVVRVSLSGLADFESTVRVERDGELYLPYIGRVLVSGLIVSEAEDRIADEFRRQQIVLKPAVKVVLEQQPSATVLVSGEVPHPGSFPIYTTSSLDRALASAGGFLQGASPVVSIIRRGYDEPILVPLGPDYTHAEFGGLPLIPGDRITVSKVGTYYVVGAVKNQGAYFIKGTTPTTVGQAIATAGGYGFEALLDSTQIARTVGDHRIMLSVRAGKILRGKAQDVSLQNDDILFIPTSETKAAIKGGATGLVVSLASTYIYAHP